jgi:hypothetical protein
MTAEGTVGSPTCVFLNSLDCALLGFILKTSFERRKCVLFETKIWQIAFDFPNEVAGKAVYAVPKPLPVIDAEKAVQDTVDSEREREREILFNN